MGLHIFIESKTTKGIDKSHIYGDALEALIGAIYLDKDYQAAKYFVTKKLLSQFVNLNEIEQTDSNYKSQLIEWSQKNKQDISFDTTEMSNKNYKQPIFNAVVKLDNKVVGKGTGTSKKEAHQKAAKQAFENLKDA